MNELARITTPPSAMVDRDAASIAGTTRAYGEGWLSFSDILRILKVKSRLVVMTTLFVVALAGTAVALMTPLYEASALVMVDERQNHVLSDVSDPTVLSNLPASPSSIDSQVQVLKSEALAGRVVDELGLVRVPEFNGTARGLLSDMAGVVANLMTMVMGPQTPPENGLPPEERLREKTIDNLQRDLDIYALGHSTVIEVDARARSAGQASRIANAIADIYVRDQIKEHLKASRDASQWLSNRVSQLAQQAATADASVAEYKAQNGLTDTSTGTPMTDQQMGDLTGQLVIAETNASDAEARLTRVKALAQSGKSADVTEVVDSPLIAQLREQEATLLQQRADLSSRYGPLHPKMRDIDAQLSELDRKISEEVDRVVGTVSNQAAVAESHVAALKRNLAALTSKTNGQNQARVKLAELEADATSAHTLYQAYLDRLKQTQQQSSLKTPDVHVVSQASVPLKPAYPKTLMIVGASVPAGLLIGFLLALISDSVCNGFRSAGELCAALGVPVLAAIPEVRSHTVRLRHAAAQVVKRPRSRFSEAVRGLELGVVRRHGKAREAADTPGKVILITSALPGEGKTTTVASLARRLALSGHRVVAVDADLRRPRLATALGMKSVKYRLADYLNQRCTLDDALFPDRQSGLVALTSVHDPEHVDDISSPRMKMLVERLREIADFVVIDSPPVLAVPDVRLIAELADTVLLTVRWERTARDAVATAANVLMDFGIELSGSVLMRVDVKRYQYYAYGYSGAPTLAGYYTG
ncbi:MAG: AAA family ATPase [Alphaproteobacteria bacterium]|nr:AAA family ATPase [Alphaproteobacteria bacterium]